MRALFWILLLGNAVFLAVARWEGSPIYGEPAPLAQPPLHPEKIGLESLPPAKPARARAPVPAPASVPDITSPASAPVPTEISVSDAAAPAASCMEWGEFSGKDLARATSALAAMRLGDKLGRREVEYNIGYWVYMPPMKDKASVNRKIAQLKARGIEEYFVVNEAGPWQNAISLGVFKTQDAAQHFLDDLRHNKDVRTAQVGERASKLKVIVFQLNGVDAGIAAEVAGIQKDYPGSELKEVPCTH